MNQTHLQSEIEQELLLFIKQNLINENVTFDQSTPLEEIGLDSFSIIEIVLFIERKYNWIIPDQLLTKETVYSVASISKCVYDNTIAK